MRPSELLLEAKSLFRRIFRIPDPWKAFRDYERQIHPTTWADQPAILGWLDRVAPATESLPDPALDPASPDPLVRLFAHLWPDLKRQFAGKHASRASCLRTIIHLPPFALAPAAHSLFQNLGQGLMFCGVPVAFWEHWGSGPSLARLLDEYQPGILLSIDHRWYGTDPAVGRESVEAIREYRRGRRLITGLACHHFPTDPAVLDRNVGDALALGVDFIYSCHASEFVLTKYRPFTDRGLRILSVEFGANPILFHPVPGGIERNLNFVYLASCNAEKWERETVYLSRVFHNHPGLILGPGWPRTVASSLPPHQLKFLYARAKVGVNLHVPFQINDPTELNERAYNLAACGVPQLMDNPALLPQRFGPKSVYSAINPDEYYRLFRHILAHPAEAAERAANALTDVLSRNTVFHRADQLIEFIGELDRESISPPGRSGESAR